MRVSLTFDNGPDIQVTPGVLETLARHHVPATFFTLGRNLAVPAQRELAVRTLAEGHRLGNHSYHHATPFGLLEQPEEGVEEILATDALLGSLGGDERLFRPFGRGEVGPHLLNRKVWDLMVARQFTCVLWTNIAFEQRNPEAWMVPMADACARETWSVAVLHDVSVTRAMDHLDNFLHMLRERGAEFTQEFPDACVPLRRGVATGSYRHLMPPEPSPDAGTVNA